MTVYGADADELDRLAAAFRQASDELDKEGGLMTRLLNNVSWIGDVAGNFVGGWSGVQLPKIGLSTQFLREAADDLSRNAAEQRRNSDRNTGTIGTITVLPDGDDRKGNWDFLEDALKEIGLGRDAIEAIIKGFEEFLGPDQVRDLLGNLLTPGLINALKVLDTALDIVDFIVNLGKDFADHAHLGMEDRITHAILDAGIRMGVEKGVDYGITFAMTALGSIVPVVGNLTLGVVGKLVGAVVSEVVAAGINAADGHLDFIDSIADTGVDAINGLRDVGGEIIEDVIDGGRDLIEDGADLIGGIKDWI